MHKSRFSEAQIVAISRRVRRRFEAPRSVIAARIKASARMSLALSIQDKTSREEAGGPSGKHAAKNR